MVLPNTVTLGEGMKLSRIERKGRYEGRMGERKFVPRVIILHEEIKVTVHTYMVADVRYIFPPA
jgi:hypothetical protein